MGGPFLVDAVEDYGLRVAEPQYVGGPDAAVVHGFLVGVFRVARVGEAVSSVIPFVTSLSKNHGSGVWWSVRLHGNAGNIPMSATIATG